MHKREQIKSIFLYCVFIFYVFFLLKLLILSRVPLLEIFSDQRTFHRSINLIPFNSIREFIFSSSMTIKSFAFSNVVGNILIFIPLGSYLLLFKKNKRVTTNLLIIFYISLSVEIIQGLLGIGASDIDDIILNGFGGLIGILGYKILAFLLRDEKKVRTVVTILSALGLPVIFYLLFMIRLRL
ncbi:VanZ family protein [Paenibacillus ferrarius]|uniref:VanZ family protein n=1 Tax=Paenibacillus ferrarius TaxID=1469647 RepID=UPI003D287B77